jgi:hypothetical protein
MRHSRVLKQISETMDLTYRMIYRDIESALKNMRHEQTGRNGSCEFGFWWIGLVKNVT